MGSLVVAPKALVKTGLATVVPLFYKLFMGANHRWNGALTRFGAISDRETLVPWLEIFAIEEVIMLDIVFIGIAVVFFAACLGYTLACERL